MKEKEPLYSILDLRGTPCPVNYVRSCLAIEELQSDDFLHIDIDTGEPEAMVIPGLQAAGHKVEVVYKDSRWLRLKVTCGVI